MHDLLIIFLATLLSTTVSLVALAVVLVLLRVFGISVFAAIRSRRAKAGEAQGSEDVSADSDLPEDVLLVILTAAVMEALDDKDTKRFRVVSFRRI